MTKQSEINEYVQKRPWALALCAAVFFLMGLSMWFIENREGGYPYVSDGMADYVLAPVSMLMGLGAFVLALRRMAR